MKNKTKTGIMRLGLLAIITLSFFYSCKSEPDYKVIRKQAMDLHDKLMIDGEIAMRNKMRLDTLAMTGFAELKKIQPALDTLKEKQNIAIMIARLNTADERMMDWMNKFQVDIEGKNNAQAVAYFNEEKLKLVKLDSLYKVALKESSDYLKRFNLDIHSDHDGHDH